MVLYEYRCKQCGDSITLDRQMHQWIPKVAPCHKCGGEAKRIFTTQGYLALKKAEVRRAALGIPDPPQNAAVRVAGDSVFKADNCTFVGDVAVYADLSSKGEVSLNHCWSEPMPPPCEHMKPRETEG